MFLFHQGSLSTPEQPRAVEAMMSGHYGTVAPMGMYRKRAAMGAVAAMAAALLVLAAIIATSDSKPHTHVLLSARVRTDIDPGSLRGLEEAAGSSGNGAFGSSSGTRLGQETVAGELEELQEQETTQKDRRTADSQAPALRQSLGRTIAKYFTTVRSVKDDQGTFLG